MIYGSGALVLYYSFGLISYQGEYQNTSIGARPLQYIPLYG